MLTIGASTGTTLHHPWRTCIAVGRAFDLTRRDLLDHVAFLQRTIGYRYCRFHAVFDDDMAVVRDDGHGGVVYQWHHVDQVYDALLAIGLKPFVELNPMPTLLASGTQTMFHFKMNVTPPREWTAWQALVRAFTAHLVQRYGLDEVASWWFEVWNEPNLGGFWSGTKADYFLLYDHAAAAVKSVSPRLRIGGPATSKANWIPEMIAHCVESGVPLDFISTHLYPQDEYVDYRDRVGSPHAPGMFFRDTVRHVQAVVRASALPELPIHWTEWNAMSCASTAGIDWTNNATNDRLHGACFAARTCADLDDAADSLCWWVASDVFAEGGIASSAFSMTYGMLTIHGIPKASYHAFRFLRELTGERVEVTLHGAPPAAGALATAAAGRTCVLVWNQQLLEDPAPAAWSGVITLPVADGTWEVLTARVTAGHGSCYETWMAMGAPHNLSASQEALLRAHAMPYWTHRRLRASNGTVTWNECLEPNELLFIDLTRVDIAALPRSVDAASLATWDQAMGEHSR